ncbi:MAG: hypothetical protein KIS79_17370 [Burkholderiales bacterium]|nr:hypothetical protein [Burkholderiales bacterium]
MQRLPGELVSEASRNLPDPFADIERYRDVITAMEDGTRVRLTFERHTHHRHKTTRHFWLLSYATPVGAAEPSAPRAF